MAINQRILAGGILIIGILVSLFLTWDALASSPFDITFPIAELNNCKDQNECKAYCDQPENAGACLAFAKKHGLVVKDELERAEKLANIKNGPGGCNSRESCESYCNNVDHIDECVAFAEQNGLMDQDDLAEAKKVRDAVKRGAKFPGGCQDKTSCEAYCSDPSKTRECLAFAKEAGFIDKEEAERAEKFIPLMERGETPGGCRSKETCEQYCFEEDHLEECIAFGEKVGAISEKEKEIIKKTGGRGPGGCRGRQCESFCREPANQKACFDFAREHGLLREEDLRRMEEGRQHLRRGLEQAPPEVKECLQAVLGPEGLTSLESGEFFGGQELGEKMRGCFEKMMQFGGPEGAGGPGGLPQGEFRGPGGCSTSEECQAFCQANPEECQRFGGGRGGPELIGPPVFEGPTYPSDYDLVCDPGWLVSIDNTGQKYCAIQESKCQELHPGTMVRQDTSGRNVCARSSQEQSSLRRGSFQGGPGGCKTPQECMAYCQANPTVCGPLRDVRPPEDGFRFVPSSPDSNIPLPPEGNYQQYQQYEQQRQQYEQQYQQQQYQQSYPSGEYSPPPQQ